MLGFGPEGLVPTQKDEEAMALCKQMKEEVLTEATNGGGTGGDHGALALGRHGRR